MATGTIQCLTSTSEVTAPLTRARYRSRNLETSRDLALDDVAAFDDRLAEAQSRLDGAVVAERIIEVHRAAQTIRREAEEALHGAATPDELVEAIGLLAAGRQRLAIEEAYLVAEAPPVERPPCFFDPSHGPGFTDAAWTTVRYGTRSVPVCLQDAVLLAAGVRPDSRTVEVDGHPVAYWAAREQTAAYLLGYFGGHPLLGWLGDRGHRLPTPVVPPSHPGDTFG